MYLGESRPGAGGFTHIALTAVNSKVSDFCGLFNSVTELLMKCEASEQILNL